MLLLIVFLLLAVRTDMKTYRIPNRLIMTGFVVGILYTTVCCFFHSAIPSGMISKTFFSILLKPPHMTNGDGIFWQMLLLIGKQFAAMMTMLIVLIPFWKVKAFGGGDVKLACISVWYIGFAATARSLLYAGAITALIGGILIATEYLTDLGVIPKEFGDRVPKLKKRNRRHLVRFSIPYLGGVLAEYVISMIIAPRL